jgi:hypothetical protein
MSHGAGRADQFVLCYAESSFDAFQQGGNRPARVELTTTPPNCCNPVGV